MSTPIIDRIDLLNESTDEYSRLQRNYAVIGRYLNVENVKTTYASNGTRLPQIGDKNPYMNVANTTVVKTVKASLTGSEEGGTTSRFKVDIGYAPQDELNMKDKEKPDEFRFPWDMPAQISGNIEFYSMDMWGTDKRGQPLKYSNGEAVHLTQDTPVFVFTITRANKLNISGDAITLSKTYSNTVNNAPVSLTISGKTHTFPARTLKCAGVNWYQDLFYSVDPHTGVKKTVPYANETITLMYDPNYWVLRIVDQGHRVKDGTIFKRVTENNGTTEINEPVPLNGAGQQLLEYGDDAFDGNLRSIKNSYGGGTLTPDLVTIDKTITEALGGRLVFLAFQNMDEVNFSGLRLNERLP